MMPKIDGIEVCRRLKADTLLPFMPIIMVTAKADTRDIVAGLEAGADEYLTKPVDQAALVARVKSMLRIKALHDTVQEQAQQLAEWNQTLEQRVQEQVGELERLGRLKRFFAAALRAGGVGGRGENLAKSPARGQRGVLRPARLYRLHRSRRARGVDGGVAGVSHHPWTVIFRFQGTLERFAGDGLMVFFNDPLPCPDHAVQAVHMAVAMRHEMAVLTERWRKRGHQLDFGVGIAQATPRWA